MKPVFLGFMTLMKWSSSSIQMNAALECSCYYGWEMSNSLSPKPIWIFDNFNLIKIIEDNEKYLWFIFVSIL